MSTPVHPSLTDLGWNASLEPHRCRLAPDQVLARVVAGHRDAFTILGERGAVLARVGGRLRRGVTSRLDLPAVGDWVTAVMPEGDGLARIDALLPRLTKLVRQGAGAAVLPQVVAANVDLVVVVTALDPEFSERRLERWARVVEASGALPLLLLNKLDLCPDPAPFLQAAERAMPGARAILASAAAGAGLADLAAAIRRGVTAVLVGSSGVGKSTTLNALLGRAAQPTLEVRSHDGTGRHATTVRELFVLPGGGLLIDTPGMRELSAWADKDACQDVPAELEGLAGDCRFRDCSHASEPGCAVREAILRGDIDPARLAAHEKLRRELAWQATRQDANLARAARQRWKAIARAIRAREEGRG